jgi:hypothetical protein
MEDMGGVSFAVSAFLSFCGRSCNGNFFRAVVVNKSSDLERIIYKVPIEDAARFRGSIYIPFIPFIVGFL